MSYSICLKCQSIVGWYDKYCDDCQKKFGLPDLREFQRTNYPKNGESWDIWSANEVMKDLKAPDKE